MKVIIDADGCPVCSLTVDECRKRKIEVTLVSDTSHIMSSDYATCVTVDKGSDSADFAVANSASKCDIVITQDYGLAAMCMAKGAYVLRQDGVEYTEDNIDLMLSQRHEAKRLRRAGKHMKGPKKRTESDDEAYIVALKDILDR